jgi:hypothetical protein
MRASARVSIKLFDSQSATGGSAGACPEGSFR